MPVLKPYEENTDRVLIVEYKKLDGTSDKRIMDVRNANGRKDMEKFVSWAVLNGVPFRGSPQKI